MSSPSIIRKQGCRDSVLEIPFPKIFYITLKIVRSDLILKYSTILVTYFKLNQSATNIAQSAVLSYFITSNNDFTFAEKFEARSVEYELLYDWH